MSSETWNFAINMINLKTLILCCFCLLTVKSLLPPIYNGLVYKDTIIASVNVSSITNCFFHCWNLIEDCVSIGFLNLALNNPKSESGLVTCHLIGNEKGSGEAVTMHVFVSIKLEILNVRFNFYGISFNFLRNFSFY